MVRYTLNQDGFDHQIEASTRDDAHAQAEEWARGGDWDLSGGTIWLEGYLTAHAPSCDSENHGCGGDGCEEDSITGIEVSPPCAHQPTKETK